MSSFFCSAGGLRYFVHTRVDAGGHVAAILAYEADPGVHVQPGKSKQVQAVGNGAAVGPGRGVNTLAKVGAVGRQQGLVGGFCNAHAAVVGPAPVKDAAGTNGNGWPQYVGQVAAAHQRIGVVDAEQRVRARDGILQRVTYGAVDACLVYRKIAEADLHQPAHGLYKPHSQPEFNLLLQLGLAGVEVAAAGLAAHVVDALPGTAHHVANLTGESAEDPLVNGSHSNWFNGLLNPGIGPWANPALPVSKAGTG